MKKIFAFSLLFSLSVGVNASTNTTGSSMLVNQLMDMQGSALVAANQILEHKGEKPHFSSQQISCMVNTDNDFATQAVQNILEKNFTKAELEQINNFYTSPAGKKHAQMAKNKFVLLFKNEDIPNVKLTAEEDEQIKAFWQSKAGTKLGDLLTNSYRLKLSPTMKIILHKKQVDCNLFKNTT